MPCDDAPVSSVAVKSYACRVTPATRAHDLSGAALNFIATVGSPTGLVTGVAGQCATTDRNSENACEVAAASR
jgi:hypothetical protein